MGSSGGKRVQSKLKLMAKLGENLYKTTKVFRMLEAKPRLKWQRFARNNASCELLALELRTRRLLWRRQLPFRGLVNAIEAPWLPRL